MSYIEEADLAELVSPDRAFSDGSRAIHQIP